MIVKCLTELLYDHECVIVPEFGAFISKECPAMLDYVNHRLMPPSKEVVFNGQLVADDGLFVGYVSNRLNVNGEEAAAMVHDFAMQSLAVLDVNATLHLEGLGILNRVNSKNLILTLDDNQNMLGDAFGLAKFSVQPIYRSETYHEIAEKIVSEQKAKNTVMTVQEEEKEPKPHRVTPRNYRWFRAAAYSMLVATAMVLLGWGIDKNGSNIASWNPLFYFSPNEFIARHISVRTEIPEVVTLDAIPALKAAKLFSNAERNYIQPVDKELLKPVDDEFYYVIGASLKSEDEAKRFLHSAKKHGFENSVVLPVNSKGNVRVAYDVVMGKDAAVKRLEIIRKEYNEAAWLLRKK